MPEPLNSKLWANLAVCLSLVFGLPSYGAEAPPKVPSAEPTPSPAADPAAPAVAFKVKQEQLLFRLLTKQLGVEKILTLAANGEPFIAVWEPDTSGKPMGAVLMLHAAGETLDSPTILANLREYLSQHGWSTLSIALPDPNFPVLPIRPMAAVPAPAVTPDQAPKDSQAGAKPADPPKKEEAAKTPPETKVVFNDAENKLGDGSLPVGQSPPVLPPPLPAEPIVMARIDAALTYLKQHDQKNIVLLGEGLGATRGAYYVYSLLPHINSTDKPIEAAPAESAENPFKAIVLINPLTLIPERPEFALNQIFTLPPLRLLDLAYSQHPATQDLAAARAKAARKANWQNFEQQIVLEPEGSDVGEIRVSRLVRGFLLRRVK